MPRVRQPTKRPSWPQLGQAMLLPWYPFFSVVDRCLECLRPHPKDLFAQGELRLAKQLVIAPSNHKLGHSPNLLIHCFWHNIMHTLHFL